jgi:hypothetical protein
MSRQVKENESDQSLRLVSLAYEVLRDMKTPDDDATDQEMLSLLSQAFFDKATALAKLEPAAPAAPKERRGTIMFSKPDDVGMSLLRRSSLSAPLLADNPQLSGPLRSIHRSS